MNRNKISLVLLALLLAISAWLLISRRSGTYARSAVEFAIADTNLIKSVEITGSGGKVMLVKHGHAWLVNGSTPARKDRMKGILVLLSRLEVISPVSRSRSEEVVRHLQNEGKHVIISLDRGGAKEYFVYHDTTETNTTYMMLKGSDTAFRMEVRGFKRRDLEALYATDDRYWRDNLILHYLPDQIQYVSLQHMRAPASTFHLARNADDGFEMSAGMVQGAWFAPDPAKLQQYLGYFYGIRFQAYADLDEESPMAYKYEKEPDYVLEVGNMAGHRTSLSLFPVYTVDVEGNKKMDLNVLYARIDEGHQMVVLKYLEIDPLLKESGYFQGK